MAVRITTNGKQLASLWRTRAERMKLGTAGALNLWSGAVKERAQSLSQGTRTTAELRGYSPGLYSVLRAANPVFDSVINAQTGRFESSWSVEPTVGIFGEQQTAVVNTAPYSKFMQGTSKMVRRPVLDRAVTESVRPVMLIRQAMANGCQGTVSTAFVGDTYYIGSSISFTTF